MSKVLRVVGQVAGAVALITSFVPGLKPISAIATGISAVANIGAKLTAPKPVARGTPAQIVLEVEPARPYIVGRVMSGGVVRYDKAYGPTLKKVPNPYRWQVRVLSGVGPIQGIAGEFFDFAPLGGFYTGFFATTQQLGLRPQPTAMVPPYGAAPGWTTSSKLSGCAAVGLNFLFDRDGERFASGVPIYTALVDGEKSYDPRQDSTFPGGSGPCRAGDESTYVFTANPAVNAITYALGRFQNGKRIYGLGLSIDAIDVPAIVDWANDCDANAWTANLILTEGGTGANLREQRVRNLDDLCAAGGGRWFQAGGVVSFDWHRPRISLATLTDADILEAGGGTDAVPTVRDRINGIRPQYVEPTSNWQQVTADEIVGSTYRTEDGTPLTQVYPLNGVTNKEQAGELASYAMADSREIGPMDLQAQRDWRFYRPGDCITVDSSLVAYSGQAVINQRSLNPDTMAVGLSLKSETPGKHDFALGKVATPPPTPLLAQTPEERDLIASAAMAPRTIDAESGSTRNVARGTYDAGTAYIRGDQVIFAGSSYLLIVDDSTGNAPPDVLRWALTAAAGSGPPGDDGLEGITIVVTNESHTVATAQDGSGGDYSTAGGSILLRRGATVLAPTFSIAAQSPATGWASINSSGDYTITDPGVNLGTATIRATWAGVNYDRTYTIAKSRQGVDGPNLRLNSTAQAFTFTDSVADPSSQTITLEAALSNLSGTATFTTSPSVTLGGSGNTRTMSLAQFGANRQVTVEATLGGITDKITILRQERNIVAAGNANRVPFSRAERGRGWSAGAFQSVFDGRFYIVLAPTFTASGQNSFIFGAPSFPVAGGERLSVSAVFQNFPLSGPSSSFWQVYIEYLDAAGTSIVGSDVIGSGVGDTALPLLAGFSTAPAAARLARIVAVVVSSGAGQIQYALLEPMVTSAAAGQTVHPPYSPGPNAVDGANPTTDITVGPDGVMNNIGTADINVDNRGVIPSGLLSARPASGAFINQAFYATDARQIYTWDGFNWRASSDLTATVSGAAEIVLDYTSTDTLITPLPATSIYSLTARGGGTFASGVTWSVSVLSGSFTGTAPSIVGTGTGEVRINSGLSTADASLRVTSSIAGQSYPPLEVKVRKAIAAATSSGGDGGAPSNIVSDNTLTAVGTSGTFAAVSDLLTIVLPAGVTEATLTAASLTLRVASTLPEGATNTEFKWQRESSPGTFTDVGAVASSSPSPTVVDSPETGVRNVAGSVTCNRTATGLGAGSTQKFRLVGRYVSGNSKSTTVTGTVSVQT